MERALIWAASGLALAIPVTNLLASLQGTGVNEGSLDQALGWEGVSMGLGVALLASTVALACARERSARNLGLAALWSVGITLLIMVRAGVFPGIAWIIAAVDIFVLLQAIEGPRQTIPFAILGNAVVLSSASIGDALDTFFYAILMSAALISSLAVWANDERHRGAMLAGAIAAGAIAVGGLAQ